MNARGSTSLEGVASLLLILSTLLASGQIARAVTAKLWFDHCLYEALICVAENNGEAICKKLALGKAQKMPLGTKNLSIKLVKRGSHWQGEMEWEGSFSLKTKARMKMALRS